MNVTTTAFDADQCAAALHALVEPGALVELRAPKPKKGRFTASGYYDAPAKLIRDAKYLSGKFEGVYVTLNPALPALLSRSANRLKVYAEQTTSDSDILSRRWLPIDFDPARPAGISSTDAEHAAALERAEDCRAWLAEQAWPAPILADSGNGAHLLYRVALPNDAEARHLVENCLKALALRFGDDKVSVDLKTGNAGRIWKLYGTLAAKGDSTPDRPHRLSRLIDTPEAIEEVPVELLRALASMIPEEPKPEARNGYGGRSDFDLERWISDHGLPVVSTGPYEGGRKWVLNPCPWNSEHTNRSAVIVQRPDGRIGAMCQHDGCAGRGWKELRELYDPKAERRRKVHLVDGQKNGSNNQQGGLVDGGKVAPSDGADLVVAPLGGQHQQQDQIAHLRQTGADLRAAYTHTRWLAKGILPVGGVGVLAATPGTGKTWFSLDLAYAVATGGSWLGSYPCEKGRVLLILEEEDPNSVVERLDLLYGGRKLPLPDGDNLPVEFLIQKGIQAVDAELNLDTTLEAHVRDFQPDLLIIDPLRRVHSLDENDSGQMSRLFNAFRQLTAIPANLCSILLVHHLKKKGEYDEGLDRLRGSSDIPASADSILDMSGELPGVLRLKHLKSKRGPSQGSFMIKADLEPGALLLGAFDLEEKAEAERAAIRSFIVEFLGRGDVNQTALFKEGSKHGYGRIRIEKEFEKLLAEGRVEIKDGKRKGSKLYHLVVDVGAGASTTRSDAARVLAGHRPKSEEVEI